MEIPHINNNVMVLWVISSMNFSVAAVDECVSYLVVKNM